MPYKHIQCSFGLLSLSHRLLFLPYQIPVQKGMVLLTKSQEYSSSHILHHLQIPSPHKRIQYPALYLPSHLLLNEESRYLLDVLIQVFVCTSGLFLLPQNQKKRCPHLLTLTVLYISGNVCIPLLLFLI